ncbi:uncharacterized protein METZ01_LOCUS361855 [marine metagenome]|uniref:Uncharacterized protein n=1 Tax=marine metagenome TaxID=408172 RepID=A0A382SJB5_9ZZZZ
MICLLEGYILGDSDKYEVINIKYLNLLKLYITIDFVPNYFYWGN